MHGRSPVAFSSAYDESTVRPGLNHTRISVLVAVSVMRLSERGSTFAIGPQATLVESNSRAKVRARNHF